MTALLALWPWAVTTGAIGVTVAFGFVLWLLTKPGRCIHCGGESTPDKPLCGKCEIWP